MAGRPFIRWLAAPRLLIVIALAGVAAAALLAVFGLPYGGSHRAAFAHIYTFPGNGNYTHLHIDADITNGSRPCDPIDDTATVAVGAVHKVGVCLETYVAKSVNSFELHIRYNGDPSDNDPPKLNVATEIADPGWPDPHLDNNPDANDSGVCPGEGGGALAFCRDRLDNDGDTLVDMADPDCNCVDDPARLGVFWDCTALDLAPPVGEDPSTPGVADARIICNAALVYPGYLTDMDLTADPGLLATIEFTAQRAGTDTIDFGPIDNINTNGVFNPRPPWNWPGTARCGTKVVADQVGCFGATIHKVAMPGWRLPWSPSEQWFLTAGPHAWNPKAAPGTPDALPSALDFAPPDHGPSWPEGDCPPSQQSALWLYPIAAGRVVQGKPWDVDGDPYVEIDHYDGRHSVYLHVADPPPEVDIGKEVLIGTTIGHPSCRNVSGGSATGAHVHLGFKLDGEWTDIRGRITLCGYRVLPPGEGPAGAVLERNGKYKYAGSLISCVGVGQQPLYQQTTPVHQGETLQVPFVVPLGRVLLGTFFGWTGSTVEAWLTAPDGTVIDPSSTDPDVFHTSGDAFQYYEVHNPQAGDWTLHLYGANVPVEGEQITAVASACERTPGDLAGDPCVADDDADGLTDEEEVGTYATDPLNPDTESDGMPDGYEVAHGCLTPLVPDGTADPDGDGLDNLTEYGLGTHPCTNDTDSDGALDGSDNCPLVANPGQENTDSGPPPSGTGGIGNGAGIAGDDRTVPNGDSLGDACDPDMDNDGIPNASDPDPGGDITYDDNNNGDPCPPLGTDAADDGPSWDSNCNGVRDSVESTCPLAVNPNGDDDGDGLKNTWEVCKWGTDPAVQDSDGDTLGDCTEAVDTNGNGIILGDYGADALNSARASLLPAGVGAGQFGKDGDFDLNGNNVVKGDFGADTLTVARFALGVWSCK
jgi:hypothetical protein